MSTKPALSDLLCRTRRIRATVALAKQIVAAALQNANDTADGWETYKRDGFYRDADHLRASIYFGTLENEYLDQLCLSPGQLIALRALCARFMPESVRGIDTAFLKPSAPVQPPAMTAADAIALGKADGQADVDNTRETEGREPVLTMLREKLGWDEAARNAGAAAHRGVPPRLIESYYGGYADGANYRAQQIADAPEPELTDEQLDDLRHEFAQQGDAEQVALCSAALRGDVAARAACAKLIREAARLASYDYAQGRT
jgi:hypothetical protein